LIFSRTPPGLPQINKSVAEPPEANHDQEDAERDGLAGYSCPPWIQTLKIHDRDGKYAGGPDNLFVGVAKRHEVGGPRWLAGRLFLWLRGPETRLWSSASRAGYGRTACVAIVSPLCCYAAWRSSPGHAWEKGFRGRVPHQGEASGSSARPRVVTTLIQSHERGRAR
jgi:hypothetical protein